MNFVMKLRIEKIIIYYHPTYLKKKNASFLFKFHTEGNEHKSKYFLENFTTTLDW